MISSPSSRTLAWSNAATKRSSSPASAKWLSGLAPSANRPCARALSWSRSSCTASKALTLARRPTVPASRLEWLGPGRGVREALARRLGGDSQMLRRASDGYPVGIRWVSGGYAVSFWRLQRALTAGSLRSRPALPTLLPRIMAPSLRVVKYSDWLRHWLILASSSSDARGRATWYERAPIILLRCP